MKRILFFLLLISGTAYGQVINPFNGVNNYTHNFGSVFTIRSMVDKGYVDSAIIAGGGGGSGTVNSGTQYRLGYYATTGTALSEAAAITAARAIVADVNGVPTHSTTTATQLAYLDIATGRTGTGALAYGTTPVFTTNITSPLIYGESAGNGDLRLHGTSSGTKTTSYLTLQEAGGLTGIGTTTPTNVLHVVGNEDFVLFERLTTATNNVGSAFVGRRISSGNMADGFGSVFTLQIQDNAAVSNSIGHMGAIRAGADNTGSLVFAPYTTGTANVRLTIPAAGGLLPGANDVGALGSASLQWGDLFIAEGGVINFDNGDATLTQAGNVVTLAGADLALSGVGIVGTATNDAAAAGNIGEEINAIQSTYTNYATTATYQNVTSITLTAGDWDISAFMTYSSNAATITAASNAIFVISTTTASAAGATEGRNIAYIPQAALLGTSLFSESMSPYRVSISGSTTYYLNTQATFTLGNPQFVGGLRGRRIR